jgi:hypothetical protein
MYLYFHLEFIRVYVLYSYIFKTETRVIFVYNTATFSFNFICKNKWYLNKNFLQRASIYRCWWLYLYEIMTLDMFIQWFKTTTPD